MPRLLRAAPRHIVLWVVSLSALLPFYVMVTAAFKTQKDFRQHPFSLPTSPTLDAFDAALSDDFVRWVLNSLILTVGSVTVTLALAAFAAWGFAQWQFKGRDTLLAALVSLMVVPPVVLVIPLFKAGSDLGLIGTYQLAIAIYVGFMLPFSIYMLTNYFRTIPKALIEAAVMDGASSFGVFRTVVLPLAAAPLITLGVVNVLWVWNELLIALVFLNDDDHRTLMVGITGFQSRNSLDVPTIMAGLTLASLPIVTLYVFGQRFFVRGLVAGAIKGE
ncbi:carbohydrate ABC transporter permease [Conexibacter woesei]|uniref:Binding-protein-dependent transport systems inner membrane component n=1 Tax=Conexibacter woesei (strain DSM 14684 / CCUG 47730 / CIP 108061 / JCM 11494 / NBRC 100937 / ID131577) TaxID=469383 RepID=D3F741_CONWI|nr:carbohydrate ABC transporter permease [Conexibacter woesei]ADB48812.1 binding-protein-dependent transport systems inner membrane component [Conexibacter woesei DSM 14684]